MSFSQKHFMPEELTPLFYTSSYRRLTAEQRLRYNQLNALCFNELIMFFETVVGRAVLGALLRESWPSRLEAGLRQFLEEEHRHTEMFRQLNRRCAPELYAQGAFHFVGAQGGWISALGWSARHPRFFLMFVWLMLLQEERSLFYSREFIRQRATLDPQFVETHRAHLADEVDHVRWDEELLDCLWCRAPRTLRRLNATLFAWMMGEFFNTPKRGQLRVVGELVREFPDLGAHEPEMRRHVLALRASASYQSSLYSRGMVPRAFARFDAWPEFRVLQRTLHGYRFSPEEAQ